MGHDQRQKLVTCSHGFQGDCQRSEALFVKLWRFRLNAGAPVKSTSNLQGYEQRHCLNERRTGAADAAKHITILNIFTIHDIDHDTKARANKTDLPNSSAASEKEGRTENRRKKSLESNAIWSLTKLRSRQCFK